MGQIIAKKSWSNAWAFIQVADNGEVEVYGKFRDPYLGNFPGPEVKDITKLSGKLLEEALQKSWTDGKSPELEAVCKEIWRTAQERNDWFGYSLD